MYVAAGETPTGIWASIEAQNAGYVAGNWQNHLVCTPKSETTQTSNPTDIWCSLQLNKWRINWPGLGSYSRLSFTAYSYMGFIGWEDFSFFLMMWDASHTTNFYTGTVLHAFENWDEARRITLEWNMDDAGLSSHLNTDIYLELVGRKTHDIAVPYVNTWGIKLYEFLMVTANCPL